MKKNHESKIIIYSIGIIALLLISLMTVYFGYFKPFVIISNGLRDSLNNNPRLEALLIAFAYIQLIFVLLPNILIVYRLVSSKKNFKPNMFFKKAIIVINIGLILINVIIDYAWCQSIYSLYNFMEIIIIPTLLAIVPTFEYEFSEHCLLRKKMEDYI